MAKTLTLADHLQRAEDTTAHAQATMEQVAIHTSQVVDGAKDTISSTKEEVAKILASTSRDDLHQYVQAIEGDIKQATKDIDEELRRHKATLQNLENKLDSLLTRKKTIQSSCDHVPSTGRLDIKGSCLRCRKDLMDPDDDKYY